MKTIFILFLLTLCLNSPGQDTLPLKRIPYTLRVAVDKNSFYEDEIGATPYLFPNNGMQIYPGETIYLEIIQDSEKIESIKAVKEIDNPNTTLTFKFSQETKNKIHQMMMLEVHNPFSKNLHYEAKMFLLKQKKWVNTDVYPVMAGISGVETWNDIIISLAISKLKFIDN